MVADYGRNSHHDEEFDCQTVRLNIDVQRDSPFNFDEDENSDTVAERPFGSMILWLGMLGLVILFVSLYFVSNMLGNEVDRLQSESVPLQTALSAPVQPLPQAQELAVTLTAVHNQTSQMAAILPTLDAENVQWPAVMAVIDDVDSSAIQLSGIEQTGNQLLIRGRAANEAFAIEYAHQLEASGQFRLVVVQSIEQVSEPFLSPTPATPSPTSTSTATSAPSNTPAPTGTATPKLCDDYEWDDTTPHSIFLGSPAQIHNFYPDLDLDQVTFLAKAGRSYEISTDSLAPGVDTFLTVMFSETTLTNDDANVGLLSSSVVMQAPADSDIEVLVQVSNRGVYGADKWYDLLVEEVIPATPTATVSPTTAPPTVTPSATAPTVTPSATADLRDNHEPNDIDPNPIAMGEAQIHNFYPDGDVDKVGFLLKNGRFYQILTSQLAVGVDTAVSVSFNGETWSNDDYDLPASGNLASSVCFAAEADGNAVATISNIGQQFDASKTYIVTVQEVPYFSVNPEEVDFGNVNEGSGTLTQTVQIGGTDGLDWTVSSETAWLGTDLITGTTPTTLTITADISGLAAGLHEGEITLGWVGSCRQTIPVTVQVDAAQSGLLPNGGGLYSVVSDRYLMSHRPFSSAKIRMLQDEMVEFVIAVTLYPVEP